MVFKATWTILPANRTDSSETSITLWVAEKSRLDFVVSTCSDWLSFSTACCLLPACVWITVGSIVESVVCSHPSADQVKTALDIISYFDSFLKLCHCIFESIATKGFYGILENGVRHFCFVFILALVAIRDDVASIAKRDFCARSVRGHGQSIGIDKVDSHCSVDLLWFCLRQTGSDLSLIVMTKESQRSQICSIKF